jgi:myosin heavy subunit
MASSNREERGWVSASLLPRGVSADPYVLVDLEADNGTEASVRLPDGAKATVPSSAISPPVTDSTTDMAMLMHLSEATVLDNLLQRYRANEPYTYTGEILTSVNPCRRQPELHTAKVMCAYAGRILGGSQPPHLYAMAEEAYRLLLKTQTHQGMVVSGYTPPSKRTAAPRPPATSAPRHAPLD